MRSYCGILALMAIICSVEVALSEGFASSTGLPTTRRQQQQPLERSFSFINPPSKLSSLQQKQEVLTVPPGGAKKSSSKTTALFLSKDGEAVSCPFTKTMAIFGSLWGSFGVIYILAKAVKRVIPIAMEP
ncbi:MAG: hypothetical protein SGILL_006631, partial [Bacillariaceae sp.]